jgi:hypothetical protein
MDDHHDDTYNEDDDTHSIGDSWYEDVNPWDYEEEEHLDSNEEFARIWDEADEDEEDEDEDDADEEDEDEDDEDEEDDEVEDEDIIFMT